MGTPPTVCIVMISLPIDDLLEASLDIILFQSDASTNIKNIKITKDNSDYNNAYKFTLGIPICVSIIDKYSNRIGSPKKKFIICYDNSNYYIHVFSWDASSGSVSIYDDIFFLYCILYLNYIR